MESVSFIQSYPIHEGVRLKCSAVTTPEYGSHLASAGSQSRVLGCATAGPWGLPRSFGSRLRRPLRRYPGGGATFGHGSAHSSRQVSGSRGCLQALTGRLAGGAAQPVQPLLKVVLLGGVVDCEHRGLPPLYLRHRALERQKELYMCKTTIRNVESSVIMQLSNSSACANSGHVCVYVWVNRSV